MIKRIPASLLLLMSLSTALLAQTTEPAAPTKIVVAADGSGQFKTLQEALDSIGNHAKEPCTILVKPGTYKEKLTFSKKLPPIVLKGDTNDASKVLITYDLYASQKGPDGKDVGTRNSASVVIDSNDFTAEDVTFENPSGDKAQAVAVRTTADRTIFRRCRFIGGQDTLYANGARHYFVDCYLEGRVDFIFGRATAVFENCTLHSKNGGFVTAASTNPDSKFGYVFLHCTLTGEGRDQAQLGRPWRPNAAVAYIECEIGSHIDPVGWNNWGKADNEKTARYVEYNNTGPGADTSKRVPWAKQLTADEAKAYTRENVLAGDDHWDPTK